MLVMQGMANNNKTPLKLRRYGTM